jgi:hypothetical protein
MQVICLQVLYKGGRGGVVEVDGGSGLYGTPCALYDVAVCCVFANTVVCVEFRRRLSG